MKKDVLDQLTDDELRVALKVDSLRIISKFDELEETLGEKHLHLLDGLRSSCEMAILRCGDADRKELEVLFRLIELENGALIDTVCETLKAPMAPIAGLDAEINELERQYNDATDGMTKAEALLWSVDQYIEQYGSGDHGPSRMAAGLSITELASLAERLRSAIESGDDVMIALEEKVLANAVETELVKLCGITRTTE